MKYVARTKIASTASTAPSDNTNSAATPDAEWNLYTTSAGQNKTATHLGAGFGAATAASAPPLRRVA